MSIKRIYVEKKAAYAVHAKRLKEELTDYLQLNQITRVRILIRYDIENISETTYQQALRTIFSEPPLDHWYEEEFLYEADDWIFSTEYLPGQFDQRADSAIQCIQLLDETQEPMVRSGITYVISGLKNVSEQELVKSFCINAVDSRESSIQKPQTLQMTFACPDELQQIDGFTKMTESELELRYQSLSLAMTKNDFKQIQRYYQIEEKREPTVTEIKVLDTYWSDHCRHTTFQTELTEVTFTDGFYRKPFEATYQQYLHDRNKLQAENSNSPVCLMDLALMAMKKLKREGKLTSVEQSEEINACSIIVPIVLDGNMEEWLINFKNETHNHPTEIEPFGGAATCLGGAIRDPLSGRTYVYQAMRISGAADPTTPLTETLKGKLPQRKIVQEAAEGYSSYGNQIGLATGYVKELYHPGYAAKRMEIGAVLGAAPRKNVIRSTVQPNDVVILLGGRTGRDGIGGATGSSKIHTESSIATCGAEVQKGNPPTERKIQRLFRRSEVSTLIKKCNDFGAGGVAVAIGELAAGVTIDLDQVPRKYAGLNGTEIAISESQERMAIVVDTADVKAMLQFANEENLEAVVVAKVTKEARLVMTWQGETIVNISRAFLDTNGARQECQAVIEIPDASASLFKKRVVGDLKEIWLKTLSDLNVCSQKGLVERFDSSIGAGSVLMPYGGKYQLSEIQTMVAKLPVLKGQTDAVTMMSYGFDPYLSSWSPYHGSVYAILSSVAKIVAVGGDYRQIHFTFQEYFQRMSGDPKRWGQPVAALLGAYQAQLGLGLAAIGGKDSMSGSFFDEHQNELHVPPTLVSFAVGTGNCHDIISPDLKLSGSKLVCCPVAKDEYDLPIYETVKHNYAAITKAIKKGIVLSAYAVERHGIMAAVSKMTFGNRLGVLLHEKVKNDQFSQAAWGDLICEIRSDAIDQLEFEYQLLGEVTADGKITFGAEEISQEEALAAWHTPLEDVFKTQISNSEVVRQLDSNPLQSCYICTHKLAVPHVFIPVFPGTNCEYDSIRAFEKAGATVSARVFKNLTAQQIRDSVALYQKEIDRAQIVMFPGGFSAGDEPEGSAKFFAAAFRNAVMKEELERLMSNRDGLILGICNGFQALIKLGLVLSGTIDEIDEYTPTLATNMIGRHVSKVVYTKVISNYSPWLQCAELGKVYCNPVSHGEGRFIANDKWLQTLLQRGQIATQYVDLDGNPSMDIAWNPNGSCLAIEGITSPDGRVFGKMAHSERTGSAVAINIYGEQDLKLFAAGVNYFK